MASTAMLWLSLLGVLSVVFMAVALILRLRWIHGGGLWLFDTWLGRFCSFKECHSALSGVVAINAVVLLSLGALALVVLLRVTRR